MGAGEYGVFTAFVLRLHLRFDAFMNVHVGFKRSCFTRLLYGLCLSFVSECCVCVCRCCVGMCAYGRACVCACVRVLDVRMCAYASMVVL